MPLPRNREDWIAFVGQWPTQSGIYIMRDSANRILYVGKAKNLRARIRSYFQEPEKLTPKTRALVKRIHELEFTVTPSELDALLLECNLIKKHRPRYNIRLKDDKNFPYVVLDFTDPFPQLRVTRKVVPSPHLKYFGPFTGSIKELSRFILKTFQIRDCSDAKFRNRTRPCLNYEIGTCTAPCVDLVTQEKYSDQIREALLFLQGKRSQLLGKLKAEMTDASEKMEYERAKYVRDKIHSIERLAEKQNAVLTDNWKNIDVIGYFEAEDHIQWVVLFIRGGFLVGRRTERTPTPAGAEENAVRSFLEQFYTVSLVPDEVWVAEEFAGREELALALEQRAERSVKVQVKRGEKAMRLLGMAQENARLLYQDIKEKRTVSASDALQEVLGLGEPPHTIEGIDVSNLQGQNPAVALVHFADERPLKGRYRLYYPRTIEGQDDFGMIHEVVLRRFSKLEENPAPDLLLIDGGKGQLSSALRALEDLGLKIPLCSLAKSRVERGFTRKEVNRSEERIFVPGRKNPILLKEGHPALRLLQSVRDEAHRFSVKSHRRRREKNSLADSPLDHVKGLGPKTKEKLLKTFGSLQALAEAPESKLREAGLSAQVAKEVMTAFQAATPALSSSDEGEKLPSK